MKQSLASFSWILAAVFSLALIVGFVSGGTSNDLVGVWDMQVVDDNSIRFHVTFFDHHKGSEGIVAITQPDTDRTTAFGHYKSKRFGNEIRFTIIDDHFHLIPNAVMHIERHNWGGTISGDSLTGEATITVTDLSGNVINQFDVDLEGERLPSPPSP